MVKAKEKSRDEQRVVVRRFKSDDQTEVSRLYTAGLLKGHIAPNDTGADIENIEAAYFHDEASYFWVADHNGQVVGMIGVAHDQKHTAEIRRLRVDTSWQQSNIAARLFETALAHCRHHGYLKVVLDTRFDPNAALDLFHRFGFQHTRTKNVQDKEMFEFYLDLYRKEQNKNSRPPNSTKA